MTIVASENPQAIVEDGCTVGGASRGEVPSNPVFPVDPLASGELVLIEVIFIAKVGVGVDVACVAAKDEHTVIEDDC